MVFQNLGFLVLAHSDCDYVVLHLRTGYFDQVLLFAVFVDFSVKYFSIIRANGISLGFRNFKKLPVVINMNVGRGYADGHKLVYF